MTTTILGYCDACGHAGPLVFASYGDPQLDDEHYAFCVDSDQCVANRVATMTAAGVKPAVAVDGDMPF
jgi:hypothetical protein